MTTFVIYKMESTGQYDYRVDRPVFVAVTQNEAILRTYLSMAEKLGIELFVEEMEPEI